MGANDKRRQLKLAKHKAKRKAKHQAIVRVANEGLAAGLTRASRAPIHECYMYEELWTTGLGEVIVSRKLLDGRIAFCVFLVDSYCLGVKDTFGRLADESQYDELIDRIESKRSLVKVNPAYARKLVESAVEYAANLGLPANSDYSRTKPIFGDIDPAACKAKFQFGKDGKPLFIAGPHDDMAKCYRILAALRDSVGDENYHFLMPVLDDDMPRGTFLADDDNDFDEDDEYDDDGR